MIRCHFQGNLLHLVSSSQAFGHVHILVQQLSELWTCSDKRTQYQDVGLYNRIIVNDASSCRSDQIRYS